MRAKYRPGGGLTAAAYLNVGSVPQSGYNPPAVAPFPMPWDPNSQSPPMEFTGICLPDTPLNDIATLGTPPSSKKPPHFQPTSLPSTGSPQEMFRRTSVSSVRSSMEERSTTPIWPLLLTRSKTMRTSIRRPPQGPVLTRPISHVQRVRAPGLRSQTAHQILTTFPVAAEYLAKGYVLSDQILQRAIELDSTCLSHRPNRSSRRPSFGLPPNREARNFKTLPWLFQNASSTISTRSIRLLDKRPLDLTKPSLENSNLVWAVALVKPSIIFRE